MSDDVMNLNDLDIDDPKDSGVDESSQVEQPKEWVDYSNEPQDEEPTYRDNSEEGPDVLTALLQKKGIQDPDHIKFQDENGQIQDRKWEDLTGEEQLNILDTPITKAEDDLDDDEIALINQLRLNNINSQEYASSLYNQGLQAGLAQSAPVQTFQVDDIPDDELYVLDLQTRAKDITNDELAQALEQAKQNPETYAKQIAGIREEYRQLEQDEINQKQAIAEQQQQENMQEFQNNILNQIDNLNQIGDLDIDMSDEDKNELAEFILGQDGAGVSYLGKALNDSETLTKMAWFALHGEDALNEIQDYFADQITRARQSGYEAGLAQAQGNPAVVVRKPTSKPKMSAYNNQNITDIDQLD